MKNGDKKEVTVLEKLQEKKKKTCNTALLYSTTTTTTQQQQQQIKIIIVRVCVICVCRDRESDRESD